MAEQNSLPRLQKFHVPREGRVVAEPAAAVVITDSNGINGAFRIDGASQQGGMEMSNLRAVGCGSLRKQRNAFSMGDPFSNQAIGAHGVAAGVALDENGLGAAAQQRP